jgi:hypothetical protein
VTSLYSELDEDGTRWYTLEDIIGHKRGADGTGTTAGWLLEVLWKEGNTTWETLSAMRDMNMPACADYAVKMGLAEEPAFNFWVKHAMKKRDRLIKKVFKRRRSNRWKYGIQVPQNVNEAYDLDKKNGNTFWSDAIAKEMKSVQVAFKVLDAGASPPETHSEIPLIMIFDVKMDFTRKARLVAGGHTTKPPETLTYASVVSRDSVRLAFLIAKMNGLEMIMTDIGSAYLHAEGSES